MSKDKTIESKAVKTKTKTSADGPGDVTPKEPMSGRFSIVGLGASAGGLEALQSFFSEVSENSTSDQQLCLNKILSILRARVGHDFSAYKDSTILRRIDRRMGLNQIKSHETYVRFLREDPGEVEVLFRELLIGVTNFFRDPESF